MITRNWVRKAALLIFFIILFFPKAAHAAILRSVITGNSFSVPTLAPLPSFSPVAIEKQNSAVQIVSPFDKSAVDKKASLPVSVHFNADKISVSGPVQQTGYGAPIMAVELLMNGTSYETKQLKPSLKEGTVVFTVSFSSLPVDINQANFQARIYTIYLPSKPPYFLPTNTPTAASTITTVFFQQVVGPQGATVLGPHGDGDVSIIIPPGALAFSIPASISMDIQAWSYAISPSDENAILGVVNVDIGNNKTNLPMDISIPAPPYVTDDDQVLVVRIIKQNGAVKYQLVDLARLINKQLVSQFIAQPFTFPQIFTTGVFGFLIPQQSVGQNANVGYVKGLVTDAKGLPIQGAVVTINTMPEFVSQTNAQGEYVIPTQIGSFSVTAVDPATGNFETSSGAVALKGGGTIVNLQLFQENLPSNTMLTNGSFENRAANWVRSGQSSLFSSLGPLLPQEGTKMLLMTTGSLSVDKTFSTLRQKFVLPANSQKLSFKYDFLTREYPQYVGSEFNDQFEANLLTQKGVIPLASMDVNNPKA
ncbi:MAG TPA: hypothetical protein VE090_01720, partial [Methylomirabilota bacterium]|nr:hypothetical protein [Methylomirabilota bacterium]